MFDTHCHLNIDVFDPILNEVISKARDTGVAQMLIPGFNIASSKKAVHISTIYKNVYSAVGIQPTEDLGKLDLGGVLVKLKEMLNDDKCLAVGEIGLDYYRYKAATSIQKKTEINAPDAARWMHIPRR